MIPLKKSILLVFFSAITALYAQKPLTSLRHDIRTVTEVELAELNDATIPRFQMHTYPSKSELPPLAFDSETPLSELFMKRLERELENDFFFVKHLDIDDFEKDLTEDGWRYFDRISIGPYGSDNRDALANSFIKAGVYASVQSSPVLHELYLKAYRLKEFVTLDYEFEGMEFKKKTEVSGSSTIEETSSVGKGTTAVKLEAIVRSNLEPAVQASIRRRLNTSCAIEITAGLPIEGIADPKNTAYGSLTITYRLKF